MLVSGYSIASKAPFTYMLRPKNHFKLEAFNKYPLVSILLFSHNKTHIVSIVITQPQLFSTKQGNNREKRKWIFFFF